MAVMVEMLCARCSRVCAVRIADFKSFRVRGTILVITIKVNLEVFPDIHVVSCGV